MKYTDLLLFDIKHIDNEQHKLLTTQSNDNILEMATYLSEIDKPVWIRHVLVPQRSDYDEYLIRLDAFIKTLNNVDKVEVLPYHTMGKYKWEELGIPYPLEGIEPPKMIVLKMRKTTTCRGLSRLSSTLTNEKIEKKTIFVVSFLFLLSLRVNQNQGVCIMSKF